MSEVTREDAEAAGSDAYKAGLPYDAPGYKLGIRQASWRIGWKREQAAAGQAGTMGRISASKASNPSNDLYRMTLPHHLLGMDPTEVCNAARWAQAEIGRLRVVLRVNLLRHVPGVTHAMIDAMLEGDGNG